MGNVCVPPSESERTDCAESENKIKLDLQQPFIPTLLNNNEIPHDMLHRCSQPSSFSKEECKYLFSNRNIEKKYLPVTHYPSQFNKFKSFRPNDEIIHNNENVIDRSEILPLPSDNNLMGEISDACSHEGFFSDLKDCRKFYRCVPDQFGYRKFTFYCAHGTAWNQSEQTCNYVTQVLTCHFSNNILTESNFQTLEENMVTSTFYPIKNTINMDITRYKNKKLTTLRYSLSSSKHNESNAIDSINSNITTFNESCFFNCEFNNGIVCNNPGFYVHPTKCNKFYRCVDNGNGFNIYYFDCPPGTIFDPSLNVCNYPESIYPPRKCKQHIFTSIEPSSTNSVFTTLKSQEVTTTASITEYTTSKTEINSSVLTTDVSKSESFTDESYLSTEKISSFSTISSSEKVEIEELSNTVTTNNYKTTSQIFDTSISTEIDKMTDTTGGLTIKETTIMRTAMPVEKSTFSELMATTTADVKTTPKYNVEMSTGVTESVTKFEELATNGLLPSENDFSNCPISSNLTDEQVLLICPTGFKRHPKFCNIIYQCTTEDNSQIKLLTLRCPENTIFDETKVQCVPESESSQPCKGSINYDRTYRRSDSKRLLNVSIDFTVKNLLYWSKNLNISS